MVRQISPEDDRRLSADFHRDVLPRWGKRSLSSITETDVLELIDDKAGTRMRVR